MNTVFLLIMMMVMIMKSIIDPIFFFNQFKSRQDKKCRARKNFASSGTIFRKT